MVPSTNAETLIYTAQTSTGSPQITSCTASSEIDSFTVSNEPELDFEFSDNSQTFEHLLHQPPYIPTNSIGSSFRRSTLRQSIIARQSTRFLTPSSHITEHMEQQMVRWNAPQSAFHVDDILNGRHAFQKEDLEPLEVQPRLQNNSILITTTDNIEDSDAPGAECVQKPTIRVGGGTVRSMVDECIDETSLVHQEPANENITSINKANSDTQANSASFSSSMLAELRRNEHSTRNSIKNSNGESHGIETPVQTPEASPLNEEDLTRLSKSQQMVSQPTMNPWAFDNRIPTASYNEDKGCYELFQEGIEDLWDDVVSCFTCNYTLMDHDSSTIQRQFR